LVKPMGGRGEGLIMPMQVRFLLGKFFDVGGLTAV